METAFSLPCCRFRLAKVRCLDEKATGRLRECLFCLEESGKWFGQAAKVVLFLCSWNHASRRGWMDCPDMPALVFPFGKNRLAKLFVLNILHGYLWVNCG